MGAMESAVQGFVTAMILGQSVSLTAEMQGALAQWVTLKLMVAEFNHRGEAIVTQAERDAFRESRDIPSGLRLWIAQCFSDKWCNAYVRHAATMTLPGKPSPSSSAKNVQTTAFGIGQLFFYAMGSAVEGVDLSNYIHLSNQFVPLWPLSGGNLQWPPASPINDSVADRIAMVFDELIRHSNVIWKPLSATEGSSSR
jgi:hypothetical protein